MGGKPRKNPATATWRDAPDLVRYLQLELGPHASKLEFHGLGAGGMPSVCITYERVPDDVYFHLLGLQLGGGDDGVW